MKEIIVTLLCFIGISSYFMILRKRDIFESAMALIFLLVFLFAAIFIRVG